MSNDSNKWFKSMKDELFCETECPEFEVLVAYNKNNLSSEETAQIEKHLLDCELCCMVTEGFSTVEDIKSIGDNSTQVIDAINSQIAVNPQDLSASKQKKKGFFKAIIEKLYSYFKDISRPSTVRYAFSITVLMMIFIGVYQNTAPKYYEYATLSSDEQDLLMLVNNRNRGGDPGENEFSLGAGLLMKVEQKRLYYFTYFDQKKLEKTIKHLKKAYNLSEEPFYQNKYAYFLGKAYLMCSDTENAKNWLTKVKSSSHSAAYQKNANRILFEIK